MKFCFRYDVIVWIFRCNGIVMISDLVYVFGVFR